MGLFNYKMKNKINPITLFYPLLGMFFLLFLTEELILPHILIPILFEYVPILVIIFCALNLKKQYSVLAIILNIIFMIIYMYIIVSILNNTINNT